MGKSFRAITIFGASSMSGAEVDHTVPDGGVRSFGVPESGKDIFSLHISPKHEIKLNQNPRSSCTSTN